MPFRDLHESEMMFRDLERRERVELELAARLEANLVRLKAWNAEPANKPARRAAAARYKKRHRAACSARERRRLERMRIEQPEYWRALLDRMSASYHEKKHDPAWLENRRTRHREWARKHRAEQKARGERRKS
jgi:hypothetical protein